MTVTATPHAAPARTSLRFTAPPTRRRPAEPPTAPRRPGPVRRVRVGAPVAPVPVPGDVPTPATTESLLGDPTALCCSVVRAAVEVLRDERPATHVARWVAPVVLDHLVERARLVRAARRDRPARRGTPVTVRRVRMLRLGTGTAEASVVLDDDGRVRAAAVRLEAHRGQWRVVVLELG